VKIERIWRESGYGNMASWRLAKAGISGGKMA
jgi:hypothetical protein